MTVNLLSIIIYTSSVNNTDPPTSNHSPPDENSRVEDEETFKALDNPLYSSTEVPEQLTDNLSASKTTSVYCLAGPSSDENNHTPADSITVTNSGSEGDTYDYAYVWTIPSVT